MGSLEKTRHSVDKRHVAVDRRDYAYHDDTTHLFSLKDHGYPVKTDPDLVHEAPYWGLQRLQQVPGTARLGIRGYEESLVSVVIPIGQRDDCMMVQLSP